jgi:predicted ATPase/class 3 adenylate cyclase/Tfp pilus assembly protein PilF
VLPIPAARGNYGICIFSDERILNQPPTGTVTFLFTDIEGSTRLWQKHPDLMGPALNRHHALLNESITAHGGYIFQIIGDAFCAAFATADDGLKAALHAQRALAGEEWGETGAIRVRMALHAGNAQVQAGAYTSGEYVSGLTLSRLARILSAGHGGQVLLSQAAYELVRDHLPDEIYLRDMGLRRLKDLVRPERLYQVVAPDLPAEFAPLKTLDARPNNLPTLLTNFIGREKELEQLKGLLAQNRLVTLTGPGGTGKTRLALQAGAELVETFEHGVWLVELASLSDGSLVPQALASVLEVMEEPGTPLLESLVRFIGDRQLLVILDNCEHLLQACAELAVHLLKAAPRLKVLATSREGLHVAGETAFTVLPLSIPDPAQITNLESLTLSEAVRMFIDRAAAAQPAFQVNNLNAPAVAEICYRLEGIPLAIELAAARVRSLPVEKIAERIGDRFRLLTGGDRASLPRHQTLRALVDWSHDLLSEPEQALLRRLSVFAGGWTLEAAEAVCPGGVVDELDVLDLLGNLVEKSLVGLHPESGRYSMLETVRQYAHEKLESAAETSTFRHQHYRFYLSLAETPNPCFTGPDHATWIERMEAEADNLRAAIQWALESGKADDALHLCFVLRKFWRAGYFSEGLSWLERALALRQEASQHALAEGLVMAGELAYDTGEIGVMDDYMSECLSIARAEGYDHLTVAALVFLGAGIYGKGDPAQAHSMLEEALAIEQKLGDKGMMSIVLLVMGGQYGREGDILQAQRFYEQSLALSREAGEIWCMSASLHNLGLILYNQGELETAQGMFEQSLAIKRPLKSKVDIANGLGDLGLIAIQKNQTERARELEVESLIIRRQIGNLFYMAVSFSGLASVLRLEGQPVKAAKLQGFVTAILEQKETKFELGEQMDYDATATALKAVLWEDGYRQAIEAGKALTLLQAIEIAQI